MQTLPNEIVGRQPNVFPVASQFQLVKLTLFGHFGEDFPLNGAWFLGNAVDYGGIEDVQTCVDVVAHKGLRLLHKSVYLSIIFGNDNAISAWIVYLCHNDGSFLAVTLVEVDQLFQGIVADDV